MALLMRSSKRGELRTGLLPLGDFMEVTNDVNQSDIKAARDQSVWTALDFAYAMILWNCTEIGL